MTAPEIPPAVQRIDYSFEKAGCWLQWHPVQGAPVSIFIPNRHLMPLSRILSGRAGMLLEDGSLKDATKEGD